MTYFELTPARAKPKSGDKLWDRVDMIAEEKMNGWRFLMHLGGDLDRTYLTGRRISKETMKFSEKGLNAPCLWPKFSSRVPDYTVIDGEIMPPDGAGFWDMASIMNSDPETAAANIRRLGNPTYHVFDVLYWNGEDMREKSMYERKRIAEQLIPHLNNPLIRILPTLEAKKEIYEGIVARGGEGVIIKDISEAYGAGWYKVKKSTTLDVIVTDFTDARHGRTGKYVGLIGAICVSVYLSDGSLVEVAQVSGMTDDLRREMTANKGEWLGKVIEIEAQEWAKSRLQSPRYKRTRDDADPRACTFTKMMEDLGVENEDKEQPKQSNQGSLF